MRLPISKFDLLCSPVRLSIVSALAVHGPLGFAALKQLLATTDGNFATHTRKLEEAKLIASSKSFEGRAPKTEYRLTPAGRRALDEYLNAMEQLIRTVRKGTRHNGAPDSLEVNTGIPATDKTQGGISTGGGTANDAAEAATHAKALEPDRIDGPMMPILNGIPMTIGDRP
jgi:DNA-binding MarR family transcriptional regulator